MRLLRDTHVMLWALAASPRLSAMAREPLVAQCEVETLRLPTADEVLLRVPVAISC